MWLRSRVRYEMAETDEDSRIAAGVERARAFAQEREADVVVFYDTAERLRVYRPSHDEPLFSESALLAYLAERKESKGMLVVILSKRHEWSDPRQTLEGFWRACREAGFERVIVQQGQAFGRPILHE